MRTSTLIILAMAVCAAACNRTTPAEQAIAEAIQAQEVEQFVSPDLAFFELRDHVRRYRQYTTYDIRSDTDGNLLLAPDAEIIPDDRPLTTEFTAVFDNHGNAIGDNLESIACDMPTTWKDTFTPGVHTRGQYVIVRDEDGYVTAEYCPLMDLRYTWRDGRLVKTVWRIPETNELMSVKEYVYNTDGLLQEVKESYPEDESGAEYVQDVTVYSNYRFDSFGNWTMRIGINDAKETVFAEIRVIEYY